ncbi:hypothetical protein [Lachnoclostridium sp.]|uniref:hypothetical protein n=1 Tax=Lachnoclostridium sp. TaxID=2028282 RepID=UPI00289CA6FA|nr:hypothetical protein [Lachnoclostridium sp.]
MNRCKICHAEVKDNSEYCLNCKELDLDHSYFNTLSESMEALHNSKDITDEDDNYIPEDYSIFGTETDDLTNNKELQSLLNHNEFEGHGKLMHSSNSDEIKDETIDKSFTQDVNSDQSLIHDTKDENELIQMQDKFKEQDEINSIEPNTDFILEQELEKVEYDDSVENEIANLSLSELVATTEEDNLEKEKIDLSDTLNDNFFNNNYKEAEGEFAVGSTPDFDGNQDILDLLNEINRTPEDNSQEDYASDVLSIDDFMDDEGSRVDPMLGLYSEPEDLLNSSTKDIGGIYQDALGGISGLEDEGIDEELLKLIPDIPNHYEVSQKEIENLEVKSKKNKKSDKEKSSRNNLFSRVFGNVKDEYSEDEREQLKQDIINVAKEKEAKALDEEKEKKATIAKKKADKLAAKKKAKDDSIKAKKAKVERAKVKKEEKERLSREVQELIDEIDANEGRINRIGASFIFALFASIAVFVVIGTNIYTYAINVQNATKNFDMQRYNEAYNQVYGLEIRDEDIEIYDKIMTVMFVNKQLNSYNNYSAIDMYPQALDSLLKGLERYDKYYTFATELGIQTDLDYVRDRIINELNEKFYVSVDEAYDIINSPTQLDYSMAVYNVILEKHDDKLVKKSEK